MSTTRKIILVAVAVLAVLLTIHVSINGLPSLSSLNPHGH